MVEASRISNTTTTIKKVTRGQTDRGYKKPVTNTDNKIAIPLGMKRIPDNSFTNPLGIKRILDSMN